MAGYPYYSPMAYQQSYPFYQQQQQQFQSQPQQTIQQSGFVLVQSEQEARAYPVAPGNSITFKDESQPYCYVKTMGFNQLDRPVFEKYKLVKEDDPVQAPTHEQQYAVKSDITAIWNELNSLKEKMKTQKRKVVIKEDEPDEDDE